MARTLRPRGPFKEQANPSFKFPLRDRRAPRELPRSDSSLSHSSLQMSSTATEELRFKAVSRNWELCRDTQEGPIHIPSLAVRSGMNSSSTGSFNTRRGNIPLAHFAGPSTHPRSHWNRSPTSAASRVARREFLHGGGGGRRGGRGGHKSWWRLADGYAAPPP